MPEPALVEEPKTFDPALFARLTAIRGVPPGVVARCAQKARPSKVVARACSDARGALHALHWALDVYDRSDEREARLATIEACPGFSPGFVRALRADLAPAECGDTMTEPVLRAMPAAITASTAHLLLGIAIAARAVRAAGATPVVDELERLARVLPVSYGRAAALAGIAEARAGARAADRAAAARAALDAMRDWGALGIGDAPRAPRARATVAWRAGWLAEVDALRLPRIPHAPRLMAHGTHGPTIADAGKAHCAHCMRDDPPPHLLAELIAQEIPSHHAAQIIEPGQLAATGTLRAWASRETLPNAARAAWLRGDGDSDSASSFAAARLALGIRSLDRSQIDRAGLLLGKFPLAERTDADRFRLALALALHGGPAALDAWAAAPPRDDAFDLGALQQIAGIGKGETVGLATYAIQVFREMRSGAGAGSRDELERQVATMGEVLGLRRDPMSLWERWNAIQNLLAQIDGEDAFSPRPERLVGWPDVRPSSGTWIDDTHTIFAAIRAGNVNRALRVLGHRFEPCFAGSTPSTEPHASPPLASLGFVIARDGTVRTATATTSPSRDAPLESCLVRETLRFRFPQPDMGEWAVDAQLRR